MSIEDILFKINTDFIYICGLDVVLNHQWLETVLFQGAHDLEEFLNYIIARAHIDGHSLVRNAGQCKDQALRAAYLICSHAGIGRGVERASVKCECKFEIRFSVSLTGEVTSNVISLQHNHAPLHAVIGTNGTVQIKFLQKHLLKEDEEKIFKAYPDVNKEREMFSTIVSKRYTELFENFDDGNASLFFQNVCKRMKYLFNIY
jgi:hypothetical protein